MNGFMCWVCKHFAFTTEDKGTCAEYGWEGTQYEHVRCCPLYRWIYKEDA